MATFEKCPSCGLNRHTNHMPNGCVSALRVEAVALRESHDALFMALVTCERKLEEEAPLTEGVAWALDNAKAALDNAQPLTAIARAAIEKAEAING